MLLTLLAALPLILVPSRRVPSTSACSPCPLLFLKRRPCIFEKRLCAQQYPGEGRAEATVRRYQAAGWRFDDISPCEFFQRIRG